MGAQNGVQNVDAGPTPKPLNQMFSKLPDTIFSVMTSLSLKHNSINLGQGFPDEEGPDSMKRMAGSAVLDFSNQYPPSMGIPELRQAVARHSEKFNQLPVDWQTETLITVGATEAIAAVFMGILNAGDEVIVFDPQYDSYACMCRRAGGEVKLVKLDDSDWSVPRDEFRAAFSPRTKLVLVNTPHNPTGRVFSREDLEFIAQLCIAHNVYVLADEVYEHLVFEGYEHLSIRSLPGMAERTLRIGSAGKTFSLTAWKIGYLVGPPPLIAAAAKAHSFLIFTVPSNLQRAVAYGLDHEESFYRQLGPRLEENRRYLDKRLPEIGFRVLPGQGTYFMIADIRPLLPPGNTATDVDFCQKLTADVGVTLIPVSALYVSDDPPKHLVRICFCKSMAKLQKACDLMEAHFRQRK